MTIIADIPPLQIPRPRLRPHRCLDISVPGTICLMRRKGREGSSVGEGLGQRNHNISQTSSQAGDCHFLLEPLDIERVHLMQKGKEGTSRREIGLLLCVTAAFSHLRPWKLRP